MDAVEPEAVGAVERGEIDVRRKPGVGAEDDVAFAGSEALVEVADVARADDQVVEPVAVDVAGARDRTAGGYRAFEAEAIRTVERGEIDARRKAGGGAENDVAFARSGRIIVADARSHNQVVEPVAVQVA